MLSKISKYLYCNKDATMIRYSRDEEMKFMKICVLFLTLSSVRSLPDVVGQNCQKPNVSLGYTVRLQDCLTDFSDAESCFLPSS